MKIALISTDGDYWGFGIRVLSSALRRAGHSPTMIFLTQDAQRYPEHVLEELSALVQSADLIGISCHSQGARRAAQAAAHLRRLRKPMVWGGVHASLNPAECATSVDAVCIGEGEETIVELADMIGSGQTWERVRNLTYLRAGHIVTNPLRPPLDNLDALPPFDFERDAEFHVSGGRIVKAPQDVPKIRQQVLFIGSRGCAFHCTYCCNRKLKELYAGAGNYIRRMSFEKYVEHLETLYTRHFPDTIRLLAKLAYPYYGQMYNLVFFPGSALYERAVRDHIIAGREDSGAELHFRGGFKYESHAWKQKNLYLNALLFLAEGKATRARVGFLPRPLIPLLTHPIVVRRLRRRSIPALSKTVIAVKMAALALRARIGGLLKQAIGDPAAVYDLWGYFLRKARRHSDSSVRATSRPAVSGGFR